MEKIDKKILKDLFNSIKSNDKEKAVEELYNKYNKLIYAIAFSILKNKEDSEDVVQNVIVKIYNLTIDKLPSDKEATWLYTVTKNEALGIIKKYNKELSIEKAYEIEDNNNEIDKTIDKHNFNNLINKLNKKEREVVSLKIISNLSFKEIGNLLGEPTSTIKWRYYNSIYKIKLLLSNFAMFVVTFVIGILTMKNEKKSSNQIEVENIEENDETYRVENSEEQKEQNIISEDLVNENTINQEIIVEQETRQTNMNYVGIGILSFSSIFLIITIIIVFFLRKNQLKRK